MRIPAPVEPVLARSIERMPPPGRPGSTFYQPKYDGYRCLARVDDSSGVHLYSRRGTLLDEAFPDIIGPLYASIPAGTWLDGEIVCWSRGRLDFAAVQRRYAGRGRAADLAVTTPAHYVVFDVLETGGRDLRRTPLRARLKLLRELFRRIPAGSPLTLSMQTDDSELAAVWLEEMPKVGVEGLVIKPAGSLYLPGRSWLKLKARQTTEAVVGGVTGSLRRPAALLLGRYASDTGRLHYAGRTTQLTDAQAKLIGPMLTRAAAADHPWPDQLTVNWRSKPTRYTRVQPLVVVEIRADIATDQGRRWRHAVRVLRVRDIAPEEVPLDLDLET
ncbi:ATP-dependent DNA ligase [Actinopolymorpha sp. B17G11]|uniref:ATP-dependent DNA ligase n=1 Tax=Actinopolymorpha sp. B17G11 TaxID=3160861 RepID=UPI0032E4E097